MSIKLDFSPDVTDLNREICEKYWLRKDSSKRHTYVYKTKDISDEYGLKTKQLLDVVSANCCIIFLDSTCIDCSKIHTCHGRTQLAQANLKDWRCGECTEAQNQARLAMYIEQAAEQRHIEDMRLQEAAEFAGRYRRTQLSSIPPISSLDFVDKLLLAALVESIGMSDAHRSFSRSSDVIRPLSPHLSMDASIIAHLSKQNILLLSDKHGSNHITPNTFDIDYYEAFFDIAYSADDLVKLVIDVKSMKNTTGLTHDSHFLFWCKQTQFYECVYYLQELSSANNLYPAISSKMINLLKTCLERHSVATVYYLIYKSVESAALFAKKSNITMKHASNTVIGNIERIFHRVDSGEWSANQSYRTNSQAVSAMSNMFFDHVFGVKNCGFDCELDDLIYDFRDRDRERDRQEYKQKMHHEQEQQDQKKQESSSVNYSTFGITSKGNYSVKFN